MLASDSGNSDFDEEQLDDDLFMQFDDLFNHPDHETYEPEHITYFPDDEPDDCADELSDEERISEPINPPPINNHLQRKSRWEGSPNTKLSAVLAILQSMQDNDMDVPLFLDALFYGDSECRSHPKCKYARQSFTLSDELPRLLRVWHKPPRTSQKGQRPLGAKLAMQTFAEECVSELVDRELRQSAHIFLSNPEDTSEEQLLATDFRLLKGPIKNSTKTLWTLLQKAAYTSKQIQHNRHKDPDMVGHLCILYLFITDLLLL